MKGVAGCQGRIFRGRGKGHGFGSRPDFELNVDGRGLVGDEPDVVPGEAAGFDSQ